MQEQYKKLRVDGYNKRPSHEGAIVFKTKLRQGKMPQEAAAHAETCAAKNIVRR